MTAEEKTFEFALRRHWYDVQWAAFHLQTVDLGYEECCKRGAHLPCGCTYESVFGKPWVRAEKQK